MQSNSLPLLTRLFANIYRQEDQKKKTQLKIEHKRMQLFQELLDQRALRELAEFLLTLSESAVSHLDVHDGNEEEDKGYESAPDANHHQPKESHISIEEFLETILPFLEQCVHDPASEVDSIVSSQYPDHGQRQQTTDESNRELELLILRRSFKTIVGLEETQDLREETRRQLLRLLVCFLSNQAQAQEQEQCYLDSATDAFTIISQYLSVENDNEGEEGRADLLADVLQCCFHVQRVLLSHCEPKTPYLPLQYHILSVIRRIISQNPQLMSQDQKEQMISHIITNIFYWRVKSPLVGQSRTKSRLLTKRKIKTLSLRLFWVCCSCHPEIGSSFFETPSLDDDTEVIAGKLYLIRNTICKNRFSSSWQMLFKGQDPTEIKVKAFNYLQDCLRLEDRTVIRVTERALRRMFFKSRKDPTIMALFEHFASESSLAKQWIESLYWEIEELHIDSSSDGEEEGEEEI